jgi:hypothetical protein
MRAARRSSLIAWAACAWVGLSGVALVDSTSGAVRSPPLFGISDDAVRFHEPNAVVARAVELGAQAIRLPVYWASVQPTAGQWDWQELDRSIGVYQAQGIRPLLLVGKAPEWATYDRDPCARFLTSRDPFCSAPPGESHLGDFQEFVRRLVERYPQAVGVEIYNEPNLSYWGWLPAANPEYYVRVLEAARAGVRAQDPKMPVVSGGLAILPRDPPAGSLTAGEFLRRFYAAGGRGVADVRSDYTGMMREMRSVRDAAGDAGRLFWITEAGYSTTSHELGVTPERQAEFLAGLVHGVYQEPDVGALFVFRLVDGNSDEREQRYGVVDAGLRPKPAFATVAAAQREELANVERAKAEAQAKAKAKAKAKARAKAKAKRKALLAAKKRRAARAKARKQAAHKRKLARRNSRSPRRPAPK